MLALYWKRVYIPGYEPNILPHPAEGLHTIEEDQTRKRKENFPPTLQQNNIYIPIRSVAVHSSTTDSNEEVFSVTR
jgi:hypothetical protein